MSDVASASLPPFARPELLAPAGDVDCIRAAIENGADAVYFGLTRGFNARVRAANMALETLPDLMALLHGRGLRGYVTLNTVIFCDELAEAERTVRAVIAAQADAVLVQDLGLAWLIREIAPDFPIHASTQMTLTSAGAIRALESLRIERVVLPRELSIREIAQLRRETSIGLEAFVHGALCVAYGGQCLTSESLGGRSANRGHCAQACRLPYEVVCDGQLQDLGRRKYLLSPQDLAAYALVPDLLAAGVGALKIEGRLKSADYVASITRHYREAIDAALAGRPVQFAPEEIEEMELTFSRGFSHGWLAGHDPKALVPGESSAKRGVLLGQVRRIDRGRIRVELARRVRCGDGVVFEDDPAASQESAQGRQQGGRVFEIFRRGESIKEAPPGEVVELAFGRGAVDPTRLRPGQSVWKTADPQVSARLQKTYRSADPIRRIPVDITVEAAPGRPLAVEARVPSGARAQAASAEPLAPAEKQPATEEFFRTQLGRLGGTPYTLRGLDARIAGRVMVPLSVLSRVRRDLVAALDAAMVRREAPALSPEPALPGVLENVALQGRPVGETAELVVLCRSLVQLETVLARGERRVAVELHDIRLHREAVAMARAASAEVFLATPRIEKPGEAAITAALLKHEPDGLLVRHLAAVRLAAERGVRFVADFSLNATNPLSVAMLRGMGAERVTASYDLNREQVLDLVAAVPPGDLEVVIHQHMPMFHMEHCVFCAVLSAGTDRRDCGRPCDRHQVQLRDRVGMNHILQSDVGCRNTLYNATPQSAAEAVPALLARGVRTFRIELLCDRPAEEIAELLQLYRRLLAGQLAGKDVWKRLRAANRVGVTRGTLEPGRDPLAIL